MKAIEIRDLRKCFKSRVAVEDLTLDVEQGEFFALLGQNGAGKTTTVKMLCGLTAPSGGDALILGDSVLTDCEKVKSKISISPQETAVAPNLSVLENLIMMAGLYGKRGAEAVATAERLMADFALTDRAGDKAKKLSGGMQRRLSIAMAMISEPSVLFLDEPTLGFDVRARRELWKHLEELKGKMTIVLTTHYLEEAEQLCDRIAILGKGRLRAIGAAEEIKKMSGQGSLEEAFLLLTEDEQ